MNCIIWAEKFCKVVLHAFSLFYSHIPDLPCEFARCDCNMAVLDVDVIHMDTNGVMNCSVVPPERHRIICKKGNVTFDHIFMHLLPIINNTLNSPEGNLSKDVVESYERLTNYSR